MQKIIFLSALLVLPSLATAQSPTAAQFQAYRQSMARELGNAYDAKAICETSAATLVQQNKQLQKQIADLNAQLKAKSPSVPTAPKPEHNPPSSSNIPDSGAK